jgi:hypothetical protein
LWILAQAVASEEGAFGAVHISKNSC